MSEKNCPDRKLLFDICRSGDKNEFLKQIKLGSINPSAYDMKDHHGKTPVHIVCRYGHIDLLRLLVEVYGCSCSVSDYTGSLPIHDACYYDQLIVVDYLVASATNPTNCLLVTDQDGNTPFHKAHQSGSLPVIRYITDLVVNYNPMKLVLFLDQVRDVRQYSKFLFVRYPPEHGDDDYSPFSRVNISKREVSDYESDSDNSESESDSDELNEDKILYLLLVNKFGDTPLSIACRHGHFNVIRYYFEFHLIRQAIQLPRLLHIASQCGHKDIIKYLLKPKLNITFRHQNIAVTGIPQPVSVQVPQTDIWYIITEELNVRQNIMKRLKIDERPGNLIIPKGAVIPKFMTKVKPKRWYTVNVNTRQGYLSYYVSLLHSIILCGETEHKIHLYKNVSSTINKIEVQGLFCACCALDSVEPLKRVLLDISGKERSYKNTLLHLACEWGAVNIVRFLLFKEKWDVNSENENGETPLHIACRHGRFEITTLLLTAKCDVNVQSSNTEETPLHIACSLQNSTIAYKLLKHTELNTYNSADRFGDTPIFNACQIGNTDLIKFMIEKGCDPMIVNDVTGDMPLHISCRKGRLDVLELLLGKSQNYIAHFNHFDESLMCAAINNNSLATIEFLAKNHICNTDEPLYKPVHKFFSKPVDCDDPIMSDTQHSEDTALHLACKNENLDLVQILVKYSNVTINNKVKNTPIHIAAVTNNVSLLQCLLQNVKDCLEFRNDNGNTALHLACLHGSLATVKVLTNYCQLTSRNKKLNTPIHLACSRGHTEIVRYLLTKLTQEMIHDVLRNDDGDTPLLIACKNDFYDIVNILLEHCSPLDQDKDGNTSIHICCIRDQHEILEALLNSIEGNSQNIIYNQDGHTYLHLACKNNTNKCVQVLLKRGYEHLVNFKDNEGNTPLHYKTDEVIVEDLLKVPTCNGNGQNKEGNTPLHMACIQGSKAIVKLLVESERCSDSLTLKNSSGHTPLYYAQDRDSINHLIINGADSRDVSNTERVKRIEDMFKKHKKENPLDPTVTALVLGNSLAGKTTLIKSLTNAYNWKPEPTTSPRKPSLGQTEMCEIDRTAGVEISEYKVLEGVTPRVLFYDFAGQPEFESTHSKLLQNLLAFSTSPNPSPILFIIVVDISSPDRLTRLAYWTKFIENCPPPLVKPEVIVIGSHADKYDNNPSQFDQIKQSLRARTECDPKSKCDNNVKFVEYPIFLDCRMQTGDELQKVQHILLTSTRNLSESAALDVRCHIVFAHLYDRFSQIPILFSDFFRSIRKQRTEYGEILCFARDNLIKLLQAMHSRQHILLFNTNDESDNFWILTAKAQSLIFQGVNSKLFASEVFEIHHEIESNVGVLSSSQLEQMFPDIERHLLIQFLQYSEICKEIEDKETLELIANASHTHKYNEETCMFTDQEPIASKSSQTEGSMNTSRVMYEPVPSIKPEYLFFPGLIKATRESLHIWKPNNTKKYSYTSGWLIKCNRDNFFNATFLQALLMRLTFKFAAASNREITLHRKCLIWKNGLTWSTYGVEILVEIINQNQSLTAFVRCLEESELEAVEIRSAILKEISEVKEKYCRATKVEEFLIVNPNFTEEGLPFVKQKVSVKELISAIKNDKVSVSDTSLQVHRINDLLSFEPYVGIHMQLLTSLFDTDKLQETVPEDVETKLFNYFKKAHANRKLVDQVMEEIQGTICSQPTVYQDIRKIFDKYSVFYGKDPFGVLHTV